MEKIKWALIGCGRVCKKHLDAIKSIDIADLIAVSDIDKEKAKQTAEDYNCKYYVDYKELLKNPEIKIVNICTPPAMHLEMIEEAAKAKKHIVCEKPMALRMIEAKKMIDICKENNVRLFVVKQNRFNAPIIKLKNALDNNRFGNLFFLNTTVRWNRNQQYYDQDGWRNKKNQGCGVLLNQTSHHLDMLYHLGGEIESVHCIKKTFAHDIEVEDGAVAIFRFKNGALGTYEGTTCAFPENIEGSITILGGKGSVKIGGFAMNKVNYWKFENELEEDKEIQKVITNPPNVYGFGHLDLLNHVTNCLINNKKSEFDADKMINSLRIIIAMQKSDKENREVLISELKDDDENYYT